MTLGEKLRSGGNRENGFDTIRLIAAALVLVSHSYPIVEGVNANEPIFFLSGGQATLGFLAVGAFFVISGLLISNSFDASSSLRSFARKRALRIMPALIVVCLLMIVLLGPIYTTLPLGLYFSEAWKFMANAVFLPHDFGLPGVFEDHPVPAVNGSLWTLKFEVACYLGAAVFLALARFRILLVLLCWALSFGIAGWLDGGEGQTGLLFYVGALAYLFRFFGTGMLLYLFRDRIPLRADWAWAALAVTALSIFTPLFVEAAATFGAYALIVFGYRCPGWFRALTARRDISYGVYVYAFPIQQMMLPLSGGSVALNIALAMPVTFLAGLLSWHLVEKPALSLKGRKLAFPPQEVAGTR